MSYRPTKPMLPFVVFIIVLFQQCKLEKATPVIASDLKTEKIKANGITIAAARCPEGKQMVGGGYTIILDKADININIRASFPVTKDTWQVEVLNASGNTSEVAFVTVYVYYYTGSKNPQMSIERTETTLTAGPAFGQTNQFFSSGIKKTYTSNVITSGGFKISPEYSINDISVLGSYPTIEGGNVSGWTNDVFVSAGKKAIITNYVMVSSGEVRVPQNIPVFDQGPTVHKKFSSVASGSSSELERSEDYFCTGGGFKTLGPNDIPNNHPINIWQNNANTSKGIFFGWQFSGHCFGSVTTKCDWDIYALQLKLH